MERKRWIDVVKGIGIILVIIGHCKRPDIILKYIQSFHMPLFFIVGGYLFSKKNGFPLFIKRKSKALLKPYAVYGIINLVIWLSYLAFKNGVDKELFDTALRYVGGLIYSRGTWYWMPNCSPIWFLTAMFVSVTLFYFILKLKSVYQYIPVLISFAAVCVIGQVGFIKLPWNVDSALWGLLYMLIGYRLKQIDFPEKIKGHKAVWSLIAVGLLAAGSFAALKNSIDFISMDSIIMGNIPLMLVSSIGISLSLIVAVILFIPKNRIVEIYGRNTVIILGTNYIVNKTVYICWDLLPEGVKTDFDWVIQCAVELVMLGVLALLSDIVKKKRNEKRLKATYE